MTRPVVLDADGLDAACQRRPPDAVRALLREAWAQGREVLVPAVVCAEVCRGVPKTRQVEATLSRSRAPLSVVDTDFGLARRVGAVLHGAGAGSDDMADAHVVAVCALYDGGLVVTSDAGDINRLAQAVPAVRIVTRPAR